MGSNRINTAAQLLQDFLQTFEKRNLETFFYSGKFFERLLSWHYELFGKQEEYLKEEKNIELWTQYSSLYRTTQSFILKILKATLADERSYAAFPFFDMLGKHYTSTKQNTKYWKWFISFIGQTFFENIPNAPGHYDIWEHNFPAEWKVTQANLEKRKDNPAAILWFFEFMRWAQNRINQVSEQADLELEEVIKELFPNVDPVLFAHFLIFTLSSYGEKRMQSLVERKWNFGYVGRIFTSHSIDTMEQDFARFQQEQQSTTIECIAYLNKTVIRVYIHDQLDQYINELEDLTSKYEKDSKEEHHRLSLLELLKALKSKENSNVIPHATPTKE